MTPLGFLEILIIMSFVFVVSDTKRVFSLVQFDLPYILDHQKWLAHAVVHLMFKLAWLTELVSLSCVYKFDYQRIIHF